MYVMEKEKKKMEHRSLPSVDTMAFVNSTGIYARLSFPSLWMPQETKQTKISAPVELTT